MENDYFNDSLIAYLKRYGLIERAKEYARVNAIKLGNVGDGFKYTSLWYAFSWHDTFEGYGFWSNHHERFLIEERLK